MAEDDRHESDGEREMSDSDSESELDPAEYEKRRELCLRQIILSEIQFNKLKIVLRDLKIKQLMKRRQDVLNQTDPEFLVKHRELLEEFNARNRLTEAIRTLEMDSLERRTVGLKKIAETNQNDNKIIAQEKLREQLLDEIRSERERQIQERIVKSYFLDERFDMKFMRPEENHRRRRYKRPRFNYPVVIGQLTQEEIEADVRSVDLAILISDIKDEEAARESAANLTIAKSERCLIVSFSFRSLRMANSELRELLDKAARKLDLPFDNEEPIDITERFFEDCSHLALGEVVRYDSFSLGEAMSAVELMDEKMDIGMKKVTRKMGLEESIAKGLYKCSLGEQLLIYDATFCTFVTWLEGSCIGQTLWTNVLLTDPERVHFEDHPVFACLSHGFYHIVMLVKSIIQNASVYEEEDFNPHLPFPCTSHYSMTDVIQLMKDIELDLVRSSEDPDKSDDKTKLLTLSSRIAFMRIFLVTLTFLVPPRKSEDWRLDSAQMPPLEALGFTADLDAATSAASKLILLSSKFLDTSMHEAAPRPDGIERDGDFSWLIAFEPELNRQYLPSTFPRKIEILPREKALPHLHRVSCKIHFMASQVRNNLSDSTSLIEFMKWFSYDDSCVLTRSILQMVIYPLRDNRFWGPTYPLFLWKILKITRTPLYDNEDCRKAVEEFTMNTTRVMLNLYQNFGE
ncbi:Mak10 subunit, NatC N(alpha)-terminal acetyltransferase [Cooperia oncophora]